MVRENIWINGVDDAFHCFVSLLNFSLETEILSHFFFLFLLLNLILSLEEFSIRNEIQIRKPFSFVRFFVLVALDFFFLVTKQKIPKIEFDFAVNPNETNQIFWMNKMEFTLFSFEQQSKRDAVKSVLFVWNEQSELSVGVVGEMIFTVFVVNENDFSSVFHVIISQCLHCLIYNKYTLRRKANTYKHYSRYFLVLLQLLSFRWIFWFFFSVLFITHSH